MFYVYILKSKKNDKYYIGSTNDIDCRLSEHNSSKTTSLRYWRPLRLVLKKEYADNYTAQAIKRKLKKMKNRDTIKAVVHD